MSHVVKIWITDYSRDNDFSQDSVFMTIYIVENAEKFQNYF